MAWMDPWRTSCWKGPARRPEIGALQCRKLIVFFFKACHSSPKQDQEACTQTYSNIVILFKDLYMVSSCFFHFQVRTSCSPKKMSSFFIHLEMLRLELALDDFVSRALADDDVRKAMESATAEGYSGPALQAVLL